MPIDADVHRIRVRQTDRNSNCPVCLSQCVRHQRRQVGFDVSRCSACGSDFAVLGPEDLPSYDEHYEPGSIYDGYHRGVDRAKSKGGGLYWYQPRMIEAAGEGHGRLHLDVGSGVGVFGHAAQQRGWKSIGLDVSPKAAEIAKAEFGIETYLLPIEELPLAPGAISWISAFEVLEHVIEPRFYIQRFHELLDEKGLVTLSVPNGRSRDEQTSTLPLNTPPTHINYFTRRSLNSLMAEHGFERIYDYEKPIPWGELKLSVPVRLALAPWLLFDALVLGHGGNRLLWVGRKKS